MFKPSRGFTLVEILVTSIIVAILAAVAIPLYAGFVSNQRLSAVTSLAETAAIQANALFRKGWDDEDAIETEVKNKLYLPDPTAYEIEIADGNVTVTDNAHPEATKTLSYQ